MAALLPGLWARHGGFRADLTARRMRRREVKAAFLYYYIEKDGAFQRKLQILRMEFCTRVKNGGF